MAPNNLSKEGETKDKKSCDTLLLNAQIYLKEKGGGVVVGGYHLAVDGEG